MYYTNFVHAWQFTGGSVSKSPKVGHASRRIDSQADRVK